MRSMAAQTQLAQQLQRGQKVDIDKARPEIKHLEVEVGWNTSSKSLCLLLPYHRLSA